MTKETSLPAKQRIWELDALRGLCILCMVAIHAFWDLSAFGGFAFDLPGWFLFCRQYGHILFILLSGLCATLASRSFQRGVYVFGAALVISYVTFFMVNVLNFPSDMLIWFGILHMLGVCMMLFPLFKRLPGMGAGRAGRGLCGARRLVRDVLHPREVSVPARPAGPASTAAETTSRCCRASAGSCSARSSAAPPTAKSRACCRA